MLSETRGKHPTCSSRYFEAVANGILIFGEALAFYEVQETHQLLVVYHPISNLQRLLRRWKGNWSNTIKVLPVAKLQDKIAIWTWKTNIHVLRKHPGLAHLKPEDRGGCNEDDEDEEDDEGDHDE